MRIDAQGDRRRAVPKPAAYRHNVEAGRDQRRCVRVPQCVEHERPQALSIYGAPPITAEGVGRVGGAIRSCENKIIVAEPAEPKRKPLFRLSATMGAVGIDNNWGDAHRAAPMARLRRFETKSRLRLL
jgi:hypothetical protein